MFGGNDNEVTIVLYILCLLIIPLASAPMLYFPILNKFLPPSPISPNITHLPLSREAWWRELFFYCLISTELQFKASSRWLLPTSLSLSFCLFLSLCFFVWVCLSSFVCMGLFVSVSLSVSVFMSFCLFLFFSLSVFFFCFFTYPYLSVCQSLCKAVYFCPPSAFLRSLPSIHPCTPSTPKSPPIGAIECLIRSLGYL